MILSSEESYEKHVSQTTRGGGVRWMNNENESAEQNGRKCTGGMKRQKREKKKGSRCELCVVKCLARKREK